MDSLHDSKETSLRLFCADEREDCDEKKSPPLLYLLARAQECGEDLGAGFCGGSKGSLRNARGEGRIWERDRDFQIRKYRSSHSDSFGRRQVKRHVKGGKTVKERGKK